MSKILLTGGTGLVGVALIARLIAQGHEIYSLTRHPAESSNNIFSLKGDILELDLGIRPVPMIVDFDACYHLAAVMNLGEDRKGNIWRTNVVGTENVVNFCAKQGIPHIFFCSTAYTRGRNVYERSKEYCENIIKSLN